MQTLAVAAKRALGDPGGFSLPLGDLAGSNPFAGAPGIGTSESATQSPIGGIGIVEGDISSSTGAGPPSPSPQLLRSTYAVSMTPPCHQVRPAFGLQGPYHLVAQNAGEVSVPCNRKTSSSRSYHRYTFSSTSAALKLRADPPGSAQCGFLVHFLVVEVCALAILREYSMRIGTWEQ